MHRGRGLRRRRVRLLQASDVRELHQLVQRRGRLRTLLTRVRLPIQIRLSTRSGRRDALLNIDHRRHQDAGERTTVRSLG